MERDHSWEEHQMQGGSLKRVIGEWNGVQKKEIQIQQKAEEGGLDYCREWISHISRG